MAERIFVSVDSCFANGQHTDGLSAFRNAGVWPSPERQSIGLGSRRRFPGAPIRVAEGVESEGRSPCVSRLTEEFNLACRRESGREIFDVVYLDTADHS
jgi:hypothetical protein